MITFFVPGTPVPKGSAKAYMKKGMRFPVVIQDNVEKQKPWASLIGYTAAQEVKGKQHNLFTGPVYLSLKFIFPRPKSHYGTGKNAATLKANAHEYHTTKPDLDKLVRCVKDALTGIVWVDDSVVVFISAVKLYESNVEPRCSRPGVIVTVKQIIKET
jgi:Holliday junction resolvase RusA-like endonuclease